MTTMAPPARRAATRATALATALAAVLALAGCGTSSGNRQGAGAQDIGKVVMVIRHGEKPGGDDDLPGIDANGRPDDSSLTQVGWQRAHALVNVFDPAGPVRPGLAKPTAIYAAGANDSGEGARTRETVKPLADKLGVRVNTSYGKGEEDQLIRDVLKQPGPTLISWQHGEIPSMAEAFGSVTPTPPSDWPDDRFDVVWTFTKATDGWHFAQVPEMVLPSDTAKVIKD